MTPYYADPWLTVLLGDCRDVLATLPSESVHCVITSPPYYGLRDYGTASWSHDIDEERIGREFIARHWSRSTAELRAELEAEAETCDHLAGPLASPKSTLQGYTGPDVKLAVGGMPYRDRCGKCGATRQDRQLGLESTPDAYVAAMVDVFREVRRVLRSDGTVWVNLGDSYAGSGKGGNPEGSPWAGFMGSNGREAAAKATPPIVPPGLKPKDLCGIPWRVAFALQADGWWLRSAITLCKLNPMPESVTDRPTSATEMMFLLTKALRYFYDADAVREQSVGLSDHDARRGDGAPSTGARISGGLAIGGATHAGTPAGGRNLRNWWPVTSEPYPGAHFATFGQKWIEPCIKAGTSERGVCPDCGAPWRRVVERETTPTQRVHNGKYDASSGFGKSGWLPGVQSVTTTGWQPTCTHDVTPVPATVIDPFAGSGTTALVANRLSRRAILIDLSADYLAQSLVRNQQSVVGL